MIIVSTTITLVCANKPKHNNSISTITITIVITSIIILVVLLPILQHYYYDYY